MDSMKPIFVIQMPIGTSPEVLGEAYEHVGNDIKEDYHVLFTIGNDTTATFKCFNSPYTPEEFTKLTDLIEKLNKEIEEIEE